MGAQELKNEFKAVLEKGFDEDFIEWCVTTFDSNDFPEDRLAAARLYLPYLKQTMKILSCDDPSDGEHLEKLLSTFDLTLPELSKEDSSVDWVIHSSNKMLQNAGTSHEDLSARSLSIGMASYALCIKKAGLDAGSYMKLFVLSWLKKFKR